MSKDNRVEDFDAIVDRLYAEIKANGGAVRYVVMVEKYEKMVTEIAGKWYQHSEGKGSEGFTYAPSYPQITEKREVVFSQSVSDLEMPALVKAVNGIA